MAPYKYTQKRLGGANKQQNNKIQRIQNQLSEIVNDDANDKDGGVNLPMLRGARSVRHRKQTRKDMRKLKKAKRAAYHSGKKIPTLADFKKPAKKKKKKKKKTEPKESVEEGSELDDHEQDSSEERPTATTSAEDLELANAADKKIIRELEKKMKMKKKKSLPQAFATEGLDYLLETIGSYDGSGATMESLSDDNTETISRMNENDSNNESDDEKLNESDKKLNESDDSLDDMDDSGDDDDDMLDKLYNDDEDDSYDFTDISDSDNNDDINFTVKMDISDRGLHKSIFKSSKHDLISDASGHNKSVTFTSDVESIGNRDNILTDKVTQSASEEDSNVNEINKSLKRTLKSNDLSHTHENMENIMEYSRSDDDVNFDSKMSIDIESEMLNDKKLKKAKRQKQSKTEICKDDAETNENTNDVRTTKRKNVASELENEKQINELDNNTEKTKKKPQKKLKAKSDIVHSDSVEPNDLDDSIRNKKLKKTTKDKSKTETKTETETESVIKDDLREDIYGRLRDAEGNVVESATYVPPGKRALMSGDSGEDTAKLERLRKQLRGLINRTSSTNMHSVSTTIEALYREYSRAHINRVLTTSILDACIQPSLTPPRLCMELVMLVAVVHSNIGAEVGAYFLQTLVKRFDALYQSGDKTKETDNALMLIAQLYNFQVIDSCLIFDVLNKLTETFTEKDIELLLLLIKNVGFSLRKDDPQSLKTVISDIQIKAQAVDTATFTDSTRIRFMLDILLAIKNNNMRKIPNLDTSHIEHLRKNLHTYITGSRGDSQLKIHYNELLKSDEHGRWWIVGSAWTPDSSNDSKLKSAMQITPAQATVSTKVLSLATKQRMNTDVRKNIFCVVMTADDYIDAYEKLLRLGLQHTQEREIIHIVLDCCLQEKTYNSFYAYLMNKICHHDRRFQMTLQFHVWDKVKVMSEMSQTNVTHLAKLLAHLIASKALSLGVIKVLEFGRLTRDSAHFLRTLLTTLLTSHPTATLQEVFGRVAVQPKLRQFTVALKLFMTHFMLKGGEDVSESLREQVNVACEVLSSGHGKTSL